VQYETTLKNNDVFKLIVDGVSVRLRGCFSTKRQVCVEHERPHQAMQRVSGCLMFGRGAWAVGGYDPRG